MTTSGASSAALGGASLAYRPDIDGLRAVAVLAVVGFHAFPGHFPGGFLGVDVFFVISGYLITGLLLREHEQAGRISLAQFYVRRIRRLFPALLLVVAATALGGWFLLFAHEFARLAGHVWASLFFAENLLLASESGYFDVDAYSKPLLHFWSLAVEEQFYIVWPLALAALAASRRLALAAIIGVGAISLAITFAGGLSEAWHFYSPLTRAWELAAGALLAWWHAGRGGFSARVSPAFLGAISLAALAILAASLLLVTEEMHHPGLVTFLPVGATAALIAAGPQGWANRHLLSLKPAAWTGLVSYPLYLWHWPLLSYLAIVSVDERGPTHLRLAMVVLAIALAAATYLLIERPIRRSLPPRLSIAAGIAGAGILAAAMMVGLLIRPASSDPVARIAQDQLEGPYWRYTANTVCERRYGPPARDFCVTNNEAPPTIALLGDSYANHFYPGLLDAPRLRGETVLSYGSCEPSASFPLPKEDCSKQLDFALSRSVEWVIVSALWPNFDEDGAITNLELGDPEALDAYPDIERYGRALDARIAALAESGAQIVIVGPTPRPGYDVADCFARPLRPASQDCRIDKQAFIAESVRTSALLQRIANRYPNAYLFDPQAIFCGEAVCSLLDANGVPLLRDEGHFSVLGSKRAGRAIAEWATQKNIPFP